jgi:hypothetical protein
MKKLKLNTETLRVLTAPAAASLFETTTGPTSDRVEASCTCTVPFTG